MTMLPEVKQAMAPLTRPAASRCLRQPRAIASKVSRPMVKSLNRRACYDIRHVRKNDARLVFDGLVGAQDQEADPRP
jgi:hypothetical protein